MSRLDMYTLIGPYPEILSWLLSLFSEGLPELGIANDGSGACHPPFRIVLRSLGGTTSNDPQWKSQEEESPNEQVLQRRFVLAATPRPSTGKGVLPGLSTRFVEVVDLPLLPVKIVTVKMWLAWVLRTLPRSQEERTMLRNQR
jgi:hypothetical protein